jgi:hypothetical protein
VPQKQEAKAVSHTPGPWRVAEDSYGGFNRIWSADGYDIATCTGDGSIPYEERIANERLIAAAPELLEALEWAMKHVEKRGTETYENYFSKAQLAIRKAKGEL